MYMKKIVSFMLVLVMAMSMSMTAFAADTTIDIDSAQSAQTVVTYGQSEGYTVVIPESVVIDAVSLKGSATISAENVVIAAGKTLNIKISGHDYDDAWELISSASDKLTYLIGTTEGDDDVVNDSVVLSAAAGLYWNSKLEEVLHFTLDSDVEKSGTYQDTLTFTVSID